MIFHQLFDPDSSTYTDILGDEATRAAAIIDLVLGFGERDLAVLRAGDLELALAARGVTNAVTVAGGTRSMAQQDGKLR